MRQTPRLLKALFNIYGPFLGAGIRIDYIRDDWRAIDVSLTIRWYNRNIMGTHFGGSLFSMIDPQYMLMLMKTLGREYVVWDKAASIEFIRPGRGTVSAKFRISDEQLDEIRARTASGEKYLPEFSVDIVNEKNELVARAIKTLYVRKKKAA